MKIDLLDPVVEVSPGQSALCRVRVRNDSVGPSAYTLRVVGLYDVDVEYPLGHDPLPAGAEARFDVSLDVPAEFAAGRHALAVEITSDRRGERPVLAGMTVDVASIHKVAMRINPSTVTGHRKGRFRVEVDNREDHLVDLDLAGQGQDLEFHFGRRRLRLQPGASVSVSGTVRGERRLVRDPANHVITVVATGRSAPIYAEATFQQRPVVPRRLRSGMAILALLGLWAGILGGGAYWYSQRDKGTPAAEQPDELVDTNGDGVPDTPAGAAADGSEAADGNGGAAGAAGEDGGSAEDAAKDVRPTTTIISGTVKAGETGDDAGVTVSLAPATLGGNPDQSPGEAASLARGGGSLSGAAKIWPARYNRASTGGISERRITESVISALSDGDGVWMFPDVTIPDNYEITFAKPGFDTKSFIVTPPEDGKAVAMDVALEPAAGSASGVVNGPNGPIGGVDIVVTDGVLTFNTKTSSEAGSVGAWSVTGLSTPNTYTLTATYRGYGTEVQQLPLDPGQQRGSVVVSMVPGVATISGHITANAAPLGGVSITASSGDLTRKATSLTLGDSGSYSLPQLQIPGTYTITAEADGYVTQTRAVSLTGNTADVDFALIRTTGSITGTVTSNTLGALPGVGITVSQGELSFNSTTAVAPSAGSFRIDDLVPGEYLVMFGRYDHTEVSQLVTIVAGETKNLGDVTMEFRDRPALVETGRLIVSVFDSATVPVLRATVQLLQISDGAVVRTATDENGTQSQFAFDNVPIGTYNIRVSRSGYRTTLKRVTMGLSERSETFNLLQLGSVTGRVIDAVEYTSSGATKQLNNYDLELYRVRQDGTREATPIQTITVPGTRGPDAESNILWESDPNSLTDGVYEIVAAKAPPGYFIAADQRLDPDDPTAIMRFTVDPTDEGTIRLNDIRANRYPSLQGRIYTPRKDTSAPDQIGFDPLDQNAQVTLTCEGKTGSLNAVLSNQVAGAGLDTYTFDFKAIAAQDLVGVCSLAISSDNFVTEQVALGVPLAVSVNGVNSDRLVNVAIGREIPEIEGSLYWVDLGRDKPNGVRVAISTASVASTGDVIVGFDPAAEGSANLPRPRLAQSPIQGIVTGGRWSVFGQLFGRATYVFDAGPGFRSGSLDVDISETGRTVADDSVLTAVDTGGADGITVEMIANPGTITGTVTTATSSTVAGASTPAVVIDSVTSPGAPQAGIASSNTTTGAYSINAAAGTWDLLFRAPTGYRFLGTGEATAEATPEPFLVEPLENQVIDPQLYQLATLDITVRNAEGGPFDGAAPVVTLERNARGITGDPGAEASIPVTLDANGHVELTNLPVNFSKPTEELADYSLTVTKDGYDTETVALTIDGTASLVPGADIGVPLIAGQRKVVDIALSKFGTISAEIIGSDPWISTPATETDLTGDPMTEITATRVRDLSGELITGPVVSVSRNANGTFSITGPPGFYTIGVSHPFYDAAVAPVDPNAPAAFPTLFRMDTPATAAQLNPPGDASNDLGPFRLQIKPASISVTAYGTGQDLVDGATVTITQGTNPVRTVATTTTVNGLVTIGNLAAGTYTVEVRKKIGSVETNDLRDERFPVRVSLSLQYGSTDDIREVDLVVRLVALDGAINGLFVGRNDLGRPVPLPPTFTVARAYTVSSGSATVDNAETANGATEDDLTGGTNPPNSYNFSRDQNAQTELLLALGQLPRGLHRLTFSADPAYTTPAPIDAAIVTNAVDVGNITYAAKKVLVSVGVTSSRESPNPVLPAATVTLTATFSTSANPVASITANYNATTKRYEALVPPDLGAWTVGAAEAQHTTGTVDKVILPQVGTYNVDLVLTPSSAKLIGNVYTKDSESANGVPLAGGGTVQLLDANNNDAVIAGANGSINGTGVYTFPSVTSAGPFKVRIALSGYQTTTSAPFSVVLGRDNVSPDLTLPKLATVSLTVANASTGTPPTARTASGVDGVCDPTNCTFSNLPPNVAQTFTVTPGTADQAYLWAGTLSATPGIGDTSASSLGTVRLEQRNIVVNVEPSGAAGATVKLGSLSPTTSTPSGSPTQFTFTRAPLAAGTVTVEKAGYFSQSAAIAADASPAADSVDTITVTLAVAEVDVSGTISGIPAGFTGTITARATEVTPNGASPRTVVVGGTDTSRSYTITGLTTGKWAISADGFRAGSGSAGVDDSYVIVGSTAPAAPITRDVVLSPRTLTYDVTVTNTATPPSGLGGVAITIHGATSTLTDGDGTKLMMVPESTNGTWTASINGYFARTGTKLPTELDNPTELDISLVQIPDVTGTVQRENNDLSTLEDVQADSVQLCTTPSAAGEACAGAGVIKAGTSATGSFTVNLADTQIEPGTYRLKITFQTQTIERTVTISDVSNGGVGTATVGGGPIIFEGPPATPTSPSTDATTDAAVTDP